MDALVAAIVDWLVAGFGLPANGALPIVRLVAPMEIEFVVHGATTAVARRRVVADVMARPLGHRAIAVYDPNTRAILLPRGWSGTAPREQSMLVHKMVHHLQAIAVLRYACSNEREKLAYAAQDAWLRRSGTTLEREFGIDSLTLLVKTTCGL